jgi:hypothetical protein
MSKPPKKKKPDQKEEKKKVDAAKKKVEREVKKLSQRTKKKSGEAKALKKEKDELKKSKVPSPDGKVRLKDIDLQLKNYEKWFTREAGVASGRIGAILAADGPEDKEAIPIWQKGMDKWYRDMVNRESGWDIGGGVRANGDISIKDKKAVIKLSGKF